MANDIAADDLALPRETGEQKSTVKCPTCGADLPVVETGYGSLTAGACKTCSVASGGDQLEAQTAAAAGGDKPEGDQPENMDGHQPRH